MKILILLSLVFTIVVSTKLNDEDLSLKNRIEKALSIPIIETIQLEITQENAKQHIVDLLQEIYNGLQDENTRTLAQVQERETTCQNSIDAIDTQVLSATQAQASLESVLPLRQDELNFKLQEVEGKQDEIKRNKLKLASFQQTREAEHKAFEDRRDEITQMVVALKAARQTIQELSSKSFLQQKETILASVKQHSKKFNQNFPNKHSHKGLVFVLLELATDSGIQGDDNAVQIIVTLIDELIESMFDVQKQEMYDDDEKTKYFFQDLQRIQIENNRLDNINAKDNAILEQLKSKLSDLESSITNQKQIISSKKIERNDWQAICKDERSSYDTLKKNRDEQIQVLVELIQLFGSSFERAQCLFAEIKA